MEGEWKRERTIPDVIARELMEEVRTDWTEFSFDLI